MPVWQKAMDIAEKCFNLSGDLPKRRLRTNFTIKEICRKYFFNYSGRFGRRTSKAKAGFMIFPEICM